MEHISKILQRILMNECDKKCAGCKGACQDDNLQQEEFPFELDEDERLTAVDKTAMYELIRREEMSIPEDYKEKSQDWNVVQEMLAGMSD